MDDEEPIALDWQVVSSVDPTERVARALCAHDGLDPDAVVTSERRATVISEDGIAESRPIGHPAWKRYNREASRFIAAFRAFKDDAEA